MRHIFLVLVTVLSLFVRWPASTACVCVTNGTGDSCVSDYFFLSSLFFGYCDLRRVNVTHYIFLA